MASFKTSVTEEFIKDRVDSSTVDTLECGQWYSGFTRTHDYAVANKFPFIGVWSNGDLCYFCKRLEKNMMTDVFKDWMKDSGCIFWFGCSLDKTEDDKAYGKGFYWGWDNKTVKTYPFFRFYWKDGDEVVSKSGSGNDWNDSKDGEVGANNIIDKVTVLLDGIHAKSPFAAPRLKIRTNPDWSEEQIAEFRQSIKDNGGYCPCVPEHSDDSKCMCKWFREQMTEGNCHCGLYNKYYAE